MLWQSPTNSRNRWFSVQLRAFRPIIFMCIYKIRLCYILYIHTLYYIYYCYYIYIYTLFYIYIYIILYIYTHYISMTIYIYIHGPDTLLISQNSWGSAWTCSKASRCCWGVECLFVHRSNRSKGRGEKVRRRSTAPHIILQCRTAWWFPQNTAWTFLRKNPHPKTSEKNEMIQSDGHILVYFRIETTNQKPGCV